MIASSTNSASGVQINNQSLRRVVRILWIILAVLFLLATIASVFMQMEEVTQRIQNNYAQSLIEVGISAQFLTAYITAVDLITTLVFMVIGTLIFLRRSNSISALITATAIFLLGGTLFTSLIRPGIFYPVAMIAMLAFFYTFPNGRFVPRWIAILFILQAVGYLIISPFYKPSFFPGYDVSANSFVLGLLSPAFISQVYRYYYVSNRIERQQSKWVLIGMALAVLGLATSTILFLVYPNISVNGSVARIRYFQIGYPLRSAFIIGLPISFAIAILRYRLWDIDLIINRSLVYGSIVALGLVSFFAALVGIQIIGGQQQPLIALLIAGGFSIAIFRPMTNRVQPLVDRRLYGLRFDLNALHAGHHRAPITKPGEVTGQILDGYEVRDLIGQGGMGEVYLGHRNGQAVAIKTMLSTIADDPDIRKRFEREAQAGLQLDHPNIAKVFTSGEHDGMPYLIMEYIQGQDLRGYIKTQGTFDEETATSVMRDVCAALDMAHGQGYVHRDLKPSNVMIRSNGQAVLMDFGITKLTDASTGLTGTGTIGTIDYMAPEQIIASKDVDHRADIYALGVMLYEMMAGEKPFKGNPAQLLFAHLQQPTPNLLDAKPDVPAQIAEAIDKAMAKDPDDRFQSAGDFAAALHDKS